MESAESNQLGPGVPSRYQRFRIWDIGEWEGLGVETSGTNKPQWYSDPQTQQIWLFKAHGTDANKLHGKAWAEKVVYEVGQLLGVPCVETHLAVHQGTFGSISKNYEEPGWEAKNGSVLISADIPSFAPRDKEREHHNLDVIQRVLTGIKAPRGSSKHLLNAFDTFAGFLVLDALTASGDRHVENWAVLEGPNGVSFLAPSWDHGNSLGFQLDDEQKQEELTKGIENWAAHGMARKFEGGRTLQLTSLALEALSRATIQGRNYWLGRVLGLKESDLRGTIDRVPTMSELERKFVFEVIVANKGRLLDDYAK